MEKYFIRFKNVGTVVSLVGLIGLLLTQFGFKVDLVWLDNTIKLVCSIGIVLGIMNNPDTKGIDLSSTIQPKIEEKVENIKE